MALFLDFAKWHLKDSESMRKKILWSDYTKLNSLGMTQEAIAGKHGILFITCWSRVHTTPKNMFSHHHYEMLNLEGLTKIAVLLN